MHTTALKKNRIKKYILWIIITPTKHWQNKNVSKFKMLIGSSQMFRPANTIKCRRKCVRMTWNWMMFIIIISTVLLVSIDVTIGKCTTNLSHNSCMNGGVCINGTCVCPDGWQGDECQFCGGKVRWVHIFLSFFFFIVLFLFCWSDTMTSNQSFCVAYSCVHVVNVGVRCINDCRFVDATHK